MCALSASPELAMTQEPTKGEVAGEDRGNISLGASIAIAEIMLMVVISVLVKIVSPEIHTLTVLFYRYALCLPLLLVAALWRHGRNAFAIAAPRTLGVRIVAGLMSLGCFYAALDPSCAFPAW